MRRRTIAFLTIGVLGLTAAGIAIVASTASSDASNEPSATPADLSLATVEQRDLTRETSFDGVVSRGIPTPLPLAGQGTLTALPLVGDVVAPGGAIAEVDGRPVILLTGDRPAWRDLRPGIDDGEDIRQLEQALADLGYARSNMTVDDEWTSATTASVKAMQKALGLEQDGGLSLGEIVFASGTVRIAEVAGHEGDNPSAAGIQVTGQSQVVLAEAEVADADLLTAGTTVTVELPSGREVPGVVFAQGAPTSNGQGGTVLPLIIAVDGLDAIDGLAVDLKVTTVDVAGATAVPAEALLALAEGGYALELPDPSSPTGTRLVAVELGAFDEEGWVEVRGDVQPGDQVVVP